MISAIIWIMIPPAKGTPGWYLPMAVVVQELFRLFFFASYM